MRSIYRIGGSWKGGYQGPCKFKKKSYTTNFLKACGAPSVQHDSSLIYTCLTEPGRTPTKRLWFAFHTLTPSSWNMDGYFVKESGRMKGSGASFTRIPGLHCPSIPAPEGCSPVSLSGLTHLEREQLFRKAPLDEELRVTSSQQQSRNHGSKSKPRQAKFCR